MSHFSRRQFLKTSVAGAGLLPAVPAWLQAAPEDKPASLAGTDIVPLGKTGIRVSRLAQGTGYNGYNRSSAHTRQGKELFDRLLRHSIDEGITFIDMADLYGSHPFVKDVIKGLPREKFVLLSKLWPRKETWVTPSGGAKAGTGPLPPGTRHRPRRRVPDPLHAERAMARGVQADSRRTVRTEG